MSPTPLLQLPPGQAKNHLPQAQSDAPVKSQKPSKKTHYDTKYKSEETHYDVFCHG